MAGKKRADAPNIQDLNEQEKNDALRQYISDRGFTFQDNEQDDVLLTMNTKVRLIRPDGNPWKGICFEFCRLKEDNKRECSKKRSDAPSLVNSTALVIDLEIRKYIKKRGYSFQEGKEPSGLLNTKIRFYLVNADGDEWDGFFHDFAKKKVDRAADLEKSHPLWSRVTKNNPKISDSGKYLFPQKAPKLPRSKFGAEQEAVDTTRISIMSDHLATEQFSVASGLTSYPSTEGFFDVNCPHFHLVSIQWKKMTKGNGIIICPHCAFEQEMENARNFIIPNFLNLRGSEIDITPIIAQFVSLFGFTLDPNCKISDIHKDKLILNREGKPTWECCRWAEFINRKAKAPEDEFFSTEVKSIYEMTGSTSVSKAVAKILDALTRSQREKGTPRSQAVVAGMSGDELKQFVHENFEEETIEKYKVSTMYLHVDHLNPQAFSSLSDANQILAMYHPSNLQLSTARENTSRQDNLRLSEIVQFNSMQREIFNTCDRVPEFNRSGEKLPRKLAVDEKSWEIQKQELLTQIQEAEQQTA